MLAIVIPYYKETFFEATLNSLADQTNKNFKVYIGDDDSPNNPDEILAKYKNQFDFVYKKFQFNIGATSLVKQWNRCIDLIIDEQWILILGDDDTLDKNVVELFYKNSELFHSYNVVRFASQKIDESGKSISQIYFNPIIENTIDFVFRETRSSLSEYVFRRSQIDNIGFKNFPLAWFSDVLAVIEFSDFKEIYSINDAIINVRMSSENISGKTNNYKLKSQATFEFYYYLLNRKNMFFSNKQIVLLLSKLTKSYLNDKKQITHFLKLSKIYLTNFIFLGYFKFISTFVLKIIKK